MAAGREAHIKPMRGMLRTNPALGRSYVKLGRAIIQKNSGGGIYLKHRQLQKNSCNVKSCANPKQSENLNFDCGEAQSLCERIVKAALSAKADEAEAFLMWGSGTSIDIEKDSLGSSSGDSSMGIGIRVLADKRCGFSYCTDEQKAREAIQDALAASKLAKPGKVTFAEPAKLCAANKGYDKKIERMEPDDIIEAIFEMVGAAKAENRAVKITSGGISIGYGGFAISNSRGVSVADMSTGIGASVSALLKDGNGSEASTGFESAVSDRLDVDFENIGRKAAKLATDAANPKKFETKETTVILGPYAAEALFEFLVAPAFYADSAEKGESIFSKKIGKQVMDKRFSIIDDGTAARGLNTAPCDDEGTPSRKTELIKAGAIVQYQYDLANAKKYKKKSTASAMRAERFSSSRSFRSPPKISGRNVILASKKNYDLDKLIEEAGEGIYVHDIMGAHTANMVSGDFSVNSTVLFQIKGGELKHPLKPVMLGGNILQCLKNMSAIGNDYRILPGQLSPVGMFLPSVCVKKVKVAA